jgi:hypothetical protein
MAVICFIIQDPGGQSFNLYLNCVHFLNTTVNVATYDSCFPALVSNKCCSIGFNEAEILSPVQY